MQPQPHSYTCSSCAAEFNGRANVTPPGWHWAGSKLLCPDCGNEPAAAPTSAERIAA